MAVKRKGYRPPVAKSNRPVLDIATLMGLLQMKSKPIPGGKMKSRYEVTFDVMDAGEETLFLNFMRELDSYRSDPFAEQPKAKNDGYTMLPGEDVTTADDPPESHPGGPTWATPTTSTMADAHVATYEADPTAEDVRAAFLKFATGRDAKAAVELLATFGVTQVKALQPEQRARFIQTCETAR